MGGRPTTGTTNDGGAAKRPLHEDRPDRGVPARAGKRTLAKVPVLGPRLVMARRSFGQADAIRAQKGYRDQFLLNTIPKSGTHYLMAILANYLWHGVLGEDERLDFVKMKTRIWEADDPETTERLQRATGYAGWSWQHVNRLIWHNNARTIVHLYRNPLDNFVSKYFFFYVNRPEELRFSGSLEAAIDAEVPPFCWHYNDVRMIAKRPNVRRFAYEQLIRDPVGVTADVLELAGLPMDEGLLQRAIGDARPENVVADEQRYGLTNILEKEPMTVSFIRSGEIGEWKEHLSDAHVRRIEEILHSYGIRLDEFVLE